MCSFVLGSSHLSVLFDFVYFCAVFAGLTPSSITYFGVFYWPHQKLMKYAFVGPRACLKTKGEFGLLMLDLLYCSILSDVAYSAVLSMSSMISE